MAAREPEAAAPARLFLRSLDAKAVQIQHLSTKCKTRSVSTLLRFAGYHQRSTADFRADPMRDRNALVAIRQTSPELGRHEFTDCRVERDANLEPAKSGIVVQKISRLQPYLHLIAKPLWPQLRRDEPLPHNSTVASIIRKVRNYYRARTGSKRAGESETGSCMQRLFLRVQTAC